MLSKEEICKIIFKHSECKCNKDFGYCEAVEEIYRQYKEEIHDLMTEVELAEGRRY